MKPNNGTNEEGVKTGAITEDELAGLSADERAALAESDDDTAALNEIADELDEDETDEEREASEKAEAEAQSKAEAEAKAKAEAEDVAKKRAEEIAAMSEEDRVTALAEDKAKAEQAAQDEADRKAAETLAAKKDDETAPTSSTVRYNAPAVEKYDEQLGALKQEMTDLNSQFKAGDVELDEFNTKQQDIQTRREALLKAQIKAEVSSEFNAQSGEREWEQQVSSFMRDAKRVNGIDYMKGEIEVDGKKISLNAELDRMVKALANDEGYADKDGMFFLTEADAIIRARYGIGKKAAGETAAEKTAREQAEKEAVKKRTVNLKSVPRTMGGLPNAVSGDDDLAGEFAHLDKLDGLELEKAVAKMTPDQQDRWSRQAA